MKKYKNKTLILFLIGILVVGFGAWRTVEAADSSIYVSPAQASKDIGDTFDISVKVDPSGQKVCAVEGNMTLTKLSCQKVTMGSGISPQTSPSCDDLSFLLGIQGCVTSKKTLFTVRVKAKSAGSGTAEFTGVDIIGEGVSLSSASSGGSYTIISTPSCGCGAWSFWQSSSCGGGSCSSIQRLQIRTRTCTPSGCRTERESRCIDDSSCIIVQESEELEERETAEVFIEESVKDLELEEAGQGLEVAEEEKTEEDKSNILSIEIPHESFLASVGIGIAQSVPLTAMTILCLIGLAGVGAREYWLFRKKREK